MFPIKVDKLAWASPALRLQIHHVYSDRSFIAANFVIQDPFNGVFLPNSQNSNCDAKSKPRPFHVPMGLQSQRQEKSELEIWENLKIYAGIFCVTLLDMIYFIHV